MQNRWFIYCLKDPRDGAIRYVGKSSRPSVRLRAHITAAKRTCKGTHRDQWIRSLVLVGMSPAMYILESGEDEFGWIKAEQEWIDTYRSLNFNLTNLTDGGEGNQGFSPSKECRAGLPPIGKESRIATA